MGFLSKWFGELEAGAKRLERAVVDDVKLLFASPKDALVKAEHGIETGATTLFGAVIGNDVKTLFDPKAETFDRVLAGLSIAADFIGPGGKALEKGALVALKGVVVHEAEVVAARGITDVEASLSKDELTKIAQASGADAQTLGKAIGYAEKILGIVGALETVPGGIGAVLADTKTSSADIAAALKATTDAERDAAWQKVEADLVKETQDSQSALDGKTPAVTPAAAAAAEAKAAVKPGAAATPPTTPANATPEETLLANAVKSTADGRVSVRVDDLLVDVHDEKTFADGTRAKLAALAAEAKSAGLTYVVYDPNVAPDQAAALGAAGIPVATTLPELHEFSLVSREARGLAATPAPAGVASPNAKPWDGKSPWEGRVTAIDTDGTFQLAVGRGTFVSFDTAQALALGIDARDVALGSYVGISRDAGRETGLRADLAAGADALPGRDAGGVGLG